MTHPAPEVPARPATATEIPTAAARLRTKAETDGWRCRTTYCRGTGIDARGRPTRTQEAVTVLCVKGRERIAATWRDGAFVSAVTPGLTRMNSLQLRERLERG